MDTGATAICRAGCGWSGQAKSGAPTSPLFRRSGALLCLVAILDWFTGTVLAWRLSATLKADLCVEALNDAIHHFGPPELMNTDQGSQVTSISWTDRLKRVGTRISMGGKGRCLDSNFIGYLWRSREHDFICMHACCETRPQAKAGVGRWITFYNHPWRPTARCGLFHRNRYRSAGAGRSSNQPKNRPIGGE